MSSRLHAPWTHRQGLGILLAFVIVYATLSATHMLVVKHTVGFERYLGHGPRLPTAVLILGQAIKALSLLGVLWLLALRGRGRDWTMLGFIACRRRWLALAVLVALVGFALNLLLARTLVASVPGWARFALTPFAWQAHDPSALGALIGMTVLVTPIAEEAFYRGFLFQWMATYRPLWAAMPVAAAIFGASHLVPSQAISAAAMSLLIMGLYLGSRSIWPCILCHALNNAIGMALGMAAVAGALPPWLTPPGGT